jgi:succinate-semialdehyde dehydrogenase
VILIKVKEINDEMINNARLAQKVFENWNQQQVDQVVRAIGKVVYDNAELLAEMAVNETGMGNYADKTAKNKGKSKTIWYSLKDKKSVGIINTYDDIGIVEIAKPIGVISSICPTTNPIVTPMSNAMFALKGRNAVIVAPHPRAKNCSSYTAKLINESIKKLGAPDNLIQVIEEPTLELTNELMKSSDAVVATGGSAMVNAAYSSGKPSFGVGPGNVQVIIDRNVNFNDVSKKVILGRSFDNGIICSGEQSIIVHENDFDEVIDAFKSNGGYVVSDSGEKQILKDTLFINNIMNKEVVGQSAMKIAEISGIKIPDSTKVILMEADGLGSEDVLCKEKMCPVIAIFKYSTFTEAIKIAQTNLELEGKGHTCAIHSNDEENINYAGLNLTVSRLVVNQPSSTTAGGAITNGFAPTTTLGCGTWGNNSISENLTYKHLINISRIGYHLTDKKIPSDSDIWYK